MNLDAPHNFSARHGHGQCVVCGQSGFGSLKLAFIPEKDGSVHGGFVSGPHVQGYDNLVHGGVIATLLDAAMTHCLFHHGITALTADLHVRYVRPVVCGRHLDIGAQITKVSHPIYFVRAEILSEGAVAAWAEAKFLPKKT